MNGKFIRLQCLTQPHHMLDLLINLTDNGKAKLLVISKNRRDGKEQNGWSWPEVLKKLGEREIIIPERIYRWWFWWIYTGTQFIFSFQYVFQNIIILNNISLSKKEHISDFVGMHCQNTDRFEQHKKRWPLNIALK